MGVHNVMTPVEVRAAVARAKNAQKSWGKTTFKQRGAVLASLMEYVLAHQDEIVASSCRVSGKTKLEAEFGEVLTTLEKCRYTMKYGANALKDEYRSPPALLFLKSAKMEYHPMGVIAAIIPWNYPFHNAFSAIISAIYAGNGCCVKVSEYASASAREYEKIMRDILIKHHADPELVQFIVGDGSSGAALINGGVDKVLFIGSPQVGKLVMKTAADTLTPVVLELGGKDAFIITDNCDFDEACDIAMRGVFTNCGQNCVAAERIYVHAKVYDEFVSRMTRRVNALTQGPPMTGHYDCGAMTMARQLEIVDELVKDAKTKGARVLAGGKRNSDPACANGQFYMPTLIVDCTHEMKVVTDEAFGPIMAVLKFETDEQVVEMANGTDYGLSAVVFCKDYARARRLGDALVAGTIIINDFGIPYLVQDLPFGGVKISGFGKFNGPEGLRSFSNQKVIVNDRFGIRTTAPAFTKYPIPSHSFKLTQHALHFIYESNWFTSLSHAGKMLGMLISPPKEQDGKKTE
jgi:acyl-CoA reductase-like NAD-dependent aldehyde dehydrogenase